MPADAWALSPRLDRTISARVVATIGRATGESKASAKLLPVERRACGAASRGT